MFSILIPTWNNLEYLKLCVDSIRRHSAYDHEILVHVNDGSDGTLDWVRAQGLRHTHSVDNIGVCLSVNLLAGMASREWLAFLNDDMVCCPGWDSALAEAITREPSDLALLSSTLIEPTDTGNPLVIVADHGRTPQDFDPAALLREAQTEVRADVIGKSSQPTVISRRWWHMVGGYSVEFGPGMSSDDDLLMKLWVVGCRSFRVVGASRLYHFACRSTGRIRKNKGARTFVTKWGITQGEFKRDFMQNPQRQSAAALPSSTPTGRMRRAVYALSGDFPLHDLRAWDPAAGRHLRDEA